MISAWLWLAAAPETPDRAAWARLSKAERSSCARLATPQLQARFVRAHDLLRQKLQLHTGIPAASLTFVRDKNRRPGISYPAACEADRKSGALDFNLSYSGSWIACAIAEGGEVGVDIERVNERVNFQRLLKRVATSDEQSWLAQLSPGARRRGFFSIWVLKEAYAKARGEGLGLPFEHFSLRPDGAATHADLERVDNQPQSWAFHRYRIRGGDEFAGQRAELALALKTGSAATPQLTVLDGLHCERYQD